MKNHPVNFCCNYYLSKSGEHFKGTSELYIHSHWDMDGKRTNHQSQGLPNNWQEMFQLAASQSGEALRLAKATFWAWAPMERPAAPTTMAWPILPSEAQATQIGCNTTPSPTPFESSGSLKINHCSQIDQKLEQSQKKRKLFGQQDFCCKNFPGKSGKMRLKRVLARF